MCAPGGWLQNPDNIISLTVSRLICQGAVARRKWKWSRSVMSDSLPPHSPPGSCIHGIFQARVLEWVAISFSRGSSRLRDQTQGSSIAGRHFTVWATREAQSLERKILKHLSSEKTQVGEPLQPVCVSRILRRNLRKLFKTFRNSLLANKGQMNQVHSTATQISPVVQDCRSFKKKLLHREKVFRSFPKILFRGHVKYNLFDVCSNCFDFLKMLFLFQTAATAKSLQSCPTLCDPKDCSLPGYSVRGILQARTLEWVAISFSNAWKWNRSVVSDSATPWTAAYQVPPSMGFSRQQYWSGVPLPSPLFQTTKA